MNIYFLSDEKSRNNDVMINSLMFLKCYKVDNTSEIDISVTLKLVMRFVTLEFNSCVLKFGNGIESKDK